MTDFYITAHARKRWIERFPYEGITLEEAVQRDLSKAAPVLKKFPSTKLKIRRLTRQYVLKGRVVITVYPFRK